jgi:hypothetical protein
MLVLRGGQYFSSCLCVHLLKSIVQQVISVAKRVLRAECRHPQPTIIQQDKTRSTLPSICSCSNDTPPTQVRRRIEYHHSISILIRNNHARRPLQHILPPRQLVINSPHIRAGPPVGPRLVHRIPLVLLGEIRVAKIVSLARRDEIEAQRTVWAESAFVGVPVEAAGGFGVAGGLKFGHAWRCVLVMGVGGGLIFCTRITREEDLL